MQLHVPLPPDIETQLPDPVQYALPYDLTHQGEPVEGYCVASKTNLYFFEQGRMKRCYPISVCQDLTSEQLIGSGSLNARIEGQMTLLCVFSHRYLTAYAEFTMALAYTQKTQIVVEDDPEDHTICPKCGTPLPPGAAQCIHCMKKGKALIRLIQFCGRHKKIIFAAVAMSLLNEILFIIAPFLQRVFIDGYIVPKRQEWPSFLLLLALNVGLYFLVYLCDRVAGHCAIRAASSVGDDLRNRVFSKIQEMSMKSLSRRTTGELINRVSGDTTKLQDFIVDYGKDAIVYSCSTLILLVVMLVVNWRLTLLVLLPLPLVIFLILRLNKVLDRRYFRTWNKWDEASDVLHDILNGIRVVKSFGTEKRETARYAAASLEMTTRLKRADIFWFLIVPFLVFLVTIGEFLVLYFGGGQVLGGQMQLGELVQFTVYVSYFYVPLRWAVNLPKRVIDATISAGKIFDVLDEMVEMSDGDPNQQLSIKGQVTFEKVSFGYKIYNPVLKEVSFTVQPGEMIGIVGHSGAGKSTLINLLMRLYDPVEGRILVDGQDIKTLSPHAYRSRIGVVLQENFLFAGTIYDNIAFSKPEASFEEVIHAAKVANAHGFIARLPDGYNTKVGDKGYSLSGGERQRIAIARAVLNDPAILILDEATASLDTETERQIQEALSRVSHGRTTFAIAHRLSTLRSADRLLVIEKGRLAEMGTHLELMQNRSVYYNLVMAQRQTAKLKK